MGGQRGKEESTKWKGNWWRSEDEFGFEPMEPEKEKDTTGRLMRVGDV